MSRGDSYMHISITDTLKQNDKFGPFISYKITTNTNYVGFPNDDINVNRRYSEFDWLSKEMSRLFPGVILPALPEKQAVGRFSSDFVGVRQRGLEKFLQRISAHSELATSQPFIMFLKSDEAALANIIADSKASKKKLSTTALAWFGGTVNTITNSGKAEIEKSAADLQVEEIIVYVAALEKQMMNVTKHADNLVKRSRENATAMFELGQSFTWLGQSEGDNLGAALTQVGTTADSVSVFGTAHSEAEAIKMQEPLDEYLRMCASIKTAMQQRYDLRSAYVDALTDVEVKQTAYNKLLGVSGKEEQANLKQQAVVKAEGAADAAKVEYEQASERLLTEFENFKYQKAIDIREIIINFVNLQIEYHRKAEESWSALLPSIQAVRVATRDGDAAGDNNGFPPSTFLQGQPKAAAGGSNNDPYNPFQDDDMVGV